MSASPTSSSTETLATPQLPEPPLLSRRLPALGRVAIAFGHGRSAAGGVLLCALIALAAFGLRELPAAALFSPLILSILIGVAFRNLVGVPPLAYPGIAFTLRRILRFAIVLLGLQLTVQQIAQAGIGGLAVMLVCLVATFAFTKWFGKFIGVSPQLAELIGAGTAVCGASAAIAMNTVTKAHEEDVAYAVACVTVFGTLAMFLYPLLPHWLPLDHRGYGLWIGSSIHEVAQVVAAGFQGGQDAGKLATIVKLSRVLMLGPLVITLGLAARRRLGAHQKNTAKAPIPYFVFGFLGMVLLGSLITIPPAPKLWIGQTTTFLLSVAVAAMGLQTDIRRVVEKGLRPLALGAAASVFIGALALALVELT
ncbi:MAG: YeiH family protein [Acidobacteriia bacterium]|nr:YeiH family putative sulfate export transporter [Methyloceanibacter sp.]MBX5472129.1 YeiH family putative sulfate export transporter [Acetobacteraceae bacterium]MCL6491180.1 YeiH family protein [Terriglobia bacterium]